MLSNFSLAFSSCDDVVAFAVIKVIFTGFRLVFLAPLSIFILILGYQHQHRQRPFKPMSHSDIFTFHVAVLELVCGLGSVCNICGFYKLSCKVMEQYFFIFSFTGEAFFHVLTCVERYLAVVHPITYRGLKNSWGVRIRNVLVGCVWILCFSWSYAAVQKDFLVITVLFYWTSAFSLVTTSFFSVSVLCVLIRPGPGEGAGDKGRSDQLKQRAFFTISAIFGAMVLWFLGLLVTSGLKEVALLLDRGALCVIQAAGLFCSLPGSLLLSLLYLHRNNRLPCSFKQNQ